MNEKGITLLETVFGVAILSMIALTLLPLTQQLQGNVYQKQLAFHASEVALNGAKMVQLYQQTTGQLEVNEVIYSWQYEQGQICVDYEGLKGSRQKCIALN